MNVACREPLAEEHLAPQRADETSGCEILQRVGGDEQKADELQLRQVTQETQEEPN